MNFIEIPTKIESKIKTKINSKIPKNIIQVYKHNRVHPHIYHSIMKMLDINPSYTYYFITYDICEELIKEHFDENTLVAYNKIKVGAAKADFIRYIMLYIYGGIYLDLDASIEIDLNKFIITNTDFIFFYRFVDEVKIVQWLIMTKPKNFIIKAIIDEMVKRINIHNETNIFLATGPDLFTDVIYNLIHHTNMYDYFNHSTIFERKKFCLDVLSKPVLNGLFYDMCEYTEQFKFRMTGYTTSMLYVDEERFTRDSNIFIEPPKPIDEYTDITNNNEEDFEKNRNKYLISLYIKTKQLIHSNFKLEQLLCNNERISTTEIKNIFTELFDDTICINELIYECIKHS
jgi:hypothetical protein